MREDLYRIRPFCAQPLNPPERTPMPEPQITEVKFAVGDNDWTATYDGSTMTVECGSLELSVDVHDNGDWVQRAKSLVEALDTWNRKGGA